MIVNRTSSSPGAINLNKTCCYLVLFQSNHAIMTVKEENVLVIKSLNHDGVCRVAPRSDNNVLYPEMTVSCLNIQVIFG